MKKYFMIGLGIVLALSLTIILYGAWLNERGEFQIAKRMSERSMELQGSQASVRFIRPRVTLNAINFYSKDMADAVALSDGRIISCLAPKGSFVRKGDTLFVIENEELPLQIQQAEANILSAQAEKHGKENQYKRFLLLKQKDAISAQQFDDAEAAYRAAVAALDVAEAKLGSLRIQEARQRVTAPLDGQVLRLYRQPGAYVQSGTSLALVGDFRTLYFATPVDDKIAGHLVQGLEAELVFSNRDFQKAYGTNYEKGNMGSEQRFLASVAEITPPVSEPAALRNVMWQADNRSGLLEPQTYGHVTMQVRTGREALSVPLDAMVDSNHTRVYVAKEDNTIEERNVKTGTNDGQFIEVLEGLKEGEVVVTSGMEGLKDGMRATVKVQGGGTK